MIPPPLDYIGVFEALMGTIWRLKLDSFFLDVIHRKNKLIIWKLAKNINKSPYSDQPLPKKVTFLIPTPASQLLFCSRPFTGQRSSSHVGRETEAIFYTQVFCNVLLLIYDSALFFPLWCSLHCRLTVFGFLLSFPRLLSSFARA